MKKILTLIIAVCTFYMPVTAYAITETTVLDTNPYGITVNAKDPYGLTDTTATWFNDANITWARMAMLWKTIETSPGVYDWSTADAQMAILKNHNISLDWILMQAPSWSVQPGCTQVPQAAAEAVFAQKVFERYGAQIKSMEVGNEEWSYEGNPSCKTPQNYISVLEPVVTALRQAGYTDLIGMFGYTHYRSDAEIQAWFNAFSTDESNPLSYIDYGNFHFYNRGQDPNVSFPGKPCFLCVVNDIHNAFASNGHGKKPIWVTEFGDQTNCTGGNCISPALEAMYQHEILEDSRLSNHVVDHAFIYTIHGGCEPKSIVYCNVFQPAFYMLKQEISSYPMW